VIPAGEEGLRIGSLSLEALRIPFEFVETLKRWVKNLRGFCGPSRDIHCRAAWDRKGSTGGVWHAARRSTANRQRVSRELRRAHGHGLSGGIAGAIAFVLNRLLEQLCARLRMHILSIGEIKVTLTLERNDSRTKEPIFHTRTIRLLVPARDSKLLLKLLQLDLEKHPPSLPVTVVRCWRFP